MHGAPGEASRIYLASSPALVVELEVRGRALLSSHQEKQEELGALSRSALFTDAYEHLAHAGLHRQLSRGAQEGGGDSSTQVGVSEVLGRNKIQTGSEAPQGAGSTGQEGGCTRKYTLPKSLKSGRGLDGRGEGSGKPRALRELRGSFTVLHPHTSTTTVLPAGTEAPRSLASRLSPSSTYNSPAS